MPAKNKNGSIPNITSVNFQSAIKAKVIPATNVLINWKIIPTKLLVIQLIVLQSFYNFELKPVELFF